MRFLVDKIVGIWLTANDLKEKLYGVYNIIFHVILFNDS